MSGYLADENFPGAAVRRLRNAGFDLAWVCELMPGAADTVVLAHAMADERVILTLDKDFGELAFHRGLPAQCGILLFRLPTSPPGPAVDRIVSTLLGRTTWTGVFCVIEQDRIRERTM